MSIGEYKLHGHIPPEVGHLYTLEELQFSFNRLDGEILLSIFNLSKLELLGLSYNDLSSNLPSSQTIGLPNHQILFLNNNRLSGEIPSSILNNSKLALLDLGDNSLSGPVPMLLGIFKNSNF